MSETEFLNVAEEAARAAGEVLSRWAGRFTVTEKGRANLVTEADFESQDVIRRVVHGRFPDHDFLGEEGPPRGESGSAYRWIIDPLDGTTNYVHGFPYYAVSIALQHRGELVVGVILDPNRDELFAAVRGRGATLNGGRIKPSEVERLEDAFAVASLPVGVSADDPAVERFLRVLPRAQTVQRTGSAALNLAYVACGRIDAFWSSSLKPWDMAAGALLVTEAGGHLSRIDGRPFVLDIPDLLSTNCAALQRELVSLLG